MSSPPPPYYALQPPPAYFCSRKLPVCPSRQSSRQSSREILSKALKRAQHAVQLDSSGSNLPTAVTAYGEAIELLQRVIARRSRRPGNEAEVERVTVIHDKYAHRVRELCRAHHLTLPNNVADAPSASCHLLREASPDASPEGDPVSPTTTLESEWDTELSSLLLSTSSASSMTGGTLSSALSIHSAHHHDRHKWIVSEACDEEVKEWGQFLSENADDRRRSVATAASAVWSTIAVSHR